MMIKFPNFYSESVTKIGQTLTLKCPCEISPVKASHSLPEDENLFVEVKTVKNHRCSINKDLDLEVIWSKIEEKSDETKIVITNEDPLRLYVSELEKISTLSSHSKSSYNYLSKLTVPTVVDTDSGLWKCKILLKSTSGEILHSLSKNIKVNVMKLPQLIVTPESRYFHEDEEVIFYVEFNEKEIKRTLWTHNGEVILPEDSLHPSRKSINTTRTYSKLVISKLQSSDIGTYTFKIGNNAGFSECSAEITLPESLNVRRRSWTCETANQQDRIELWTHRRNSRKRIDARNLVSSSISQEKSRSREQKSEDFAADISNNCTLSSFGKSTTRTSMDSASGLIKGLNLWLENRSFREQKIIFYYKTFEVNENHKIGSSLKGPVFISRIEVRI